MIFLEILIGYVLFIFVGLRLIVPHLGFWKDPLPATLPEDLRTVIEKINSESADNFEFLRGVYTFITTRYHGGRTRTVTNFWRAFQDPVGQTPGFLPCNGLNYLIRLMLVKSGRFQDSDIEIKTVPLNAFIHQYLRVKVGDRLVDVDPWSAFLGVPLGKKSAYIG